jgi:hypothetical protein
MERYRLAFVRGQGVDDSPTDKLIARLVTALFDIREGCAFSIRLPISGKALDFEDIAKLAAGAINWKPGMSLEDVLLAVLEE